MKSIMSLLLLCAALLCLSGCSCRCPDDGQYLRSKLEKARGEAESVQPSICQGGGYHPNEADKKTHQHYFVADPRYPDGQHLIETSEFH